MQNQPVSLQDIQARELESQLRTKRIKAERIVAKYNNDPKSLNDEEAQTALDIAEVLGYSSRAGKQKDKIDWNNATERAQAIAAFGVGAVDSATLGFLIKNDWYTDRRNKHLGKYGRLAGDIALLASTMGASGGYMATKALPGAVKAASKFAKLKQMKTMMDVAKKAKAGASAVKATQSALSGAKSLMTGANAYKYGARALAVGNAYKTTYNDFLRQTQAQLMAGQTGELPPLPQQQ